MNVAEAAKILTVAAGFDRRQVTEVTATAWAAALQGYGYTECEAAIIAHHRDPATRGAYLEVKHLLDRLEAQHRARTVDVETDVRAAKARGLLDASHPPREPLPTEVALLLQIARERDRAESRRYLEIGQ